MSKGSSFLDIGSSNLYSASEEEIKEFLLDYGVKPPQDDVIARLSKGSLYDPVSGGQNDSFVGELLDLVGVDYAIFDIADSCNTEVLDLNRQRVSTKNFERFDTVANFGTTEHLLNQPNAFEAIHDATKVDGIMIHNLPACGWVDHGYITYTARFFFDLASSNGYEIERLDFEGPMPGKNLHDSSRDFLTYFPSLKQTLSNAVSTELEHLVVPNVSIMIYLKKKKSGKFIAAMETTTSVGSIYRDGHTGGSEADERLLTHLVEEVNRLRAEMDMIKKISYPLRWARRNFLKR